LKSATCTEHNVLRPNLPEAQYPTIQGCPNGLRYAFEKAKRLAREGPGVAYIDPSAMGEPTFVVFSDADWEEFVSTGQFTLDQSNAIVVYADQVADAIAEKAISDGTGLHSSQPPYN
jgi:hypothetical protein